MKNNIHGDKDKKRMNEVQEAICPRGVAPGRGAGRVEKEAIKERPCTLFGDHTLWASIVPIEFCEAETRRPLQYSAINASERERRGRNHKASHSLDCVHHLCSFVVSGFCCAMFCLLR